MHKRYVDDVLTIFFNEKTANEFNQKLNNFYQDLMFTKEIVHHINFPFLT